MKTLHACLTLILFPIITFAQNWTMGVEMGTGIIDAEHSLEYQYPNYSGNWQVSNTSASYLKLMGGYASFNLTGSDLFAMRVDGGIILGGYESSGFHNYQLADCRGTGGCLFAIDSGFYRTTSLTAGAYTGFTIEAVFGIYSVFVHPTVSYEVVLSSGLKSDHASGLEDQYQSTWRNQNQMLLLSAKIGVQITTERGYIAPFIRPQLWNLKPKEDDFSPEWSQTVQLGAANLQAQYWMGLGVEFGFKTKKMPKIREVESID